MATQSLAAEEAHLYWFSLDVPDERQAEMCVCLSDDERARFARLVREQDQQRYAVARATLRQTLANYVSRSPHEVQFRQAAHGKPFLPTEGAKLPLEFNLSHSGGYAAIVVARVPVGVDIEVVRSNVKVDSVAGSYFTDEEQAVLAAVPADEKYRQFFRTWTRKEAFLKGIGSGLTIRASSVSIQQIAHSGDVAHRLRIHAPDLDPEPHQWTIRDLNLNGCVTAALAFRGKLTQLQISRDAELPRGQ